MTRLPIAIVGCGGMGGRHLLGLKALYESPYCNVELVATCDLRRDNAERLADEAERLLGSRPQVYGDMAEMVAAQPNLAAVDIATDAGSHHIVTGIAFDLGLHVLSEKPLALTVRGANRILAAQKRAGKTLSVAENYRRDPMARLTKALLDAGAIGDVRMFFDVSAGAGNRIIILPWRHYKNVGGILLDGGVHNADLMQYYMGDVRDVYARLQLQEPIRYKGSGGGVSGFYEAWQAEIPESIEATAEDTLVSVIGFEDGALGQWTAYYAGHGGGFGGKAIYGSTGRLQPGGIRNGVSPVLQIDGQDPITGDALLDLAPDLCLDSLTAHLFGGERLGSYDLPFPAADRGLLAIEYWEFADCVLQGREPEVNGEVGRRALAICYAAFESSVLGRTVTLDEIIAEDTGEYEAEINAHWKIS